MKIFKLTNPDDSPKVDITISRNPNGGEITTRKEIIGSKSSIFVDETTGASLMRRFDVLKNEIYELPEIEIYNPTDLEIKFGSVEIAPKKSVIVDRHLGGELLHAYGFLVGREYIKKVSKGATKVAKPRVKVAGIKRRRK